MNLVEALAVDQRANVGAFIHAVTNRHATDAPADFREESIGDAALHVDAVGADTGLPAAAELVGDQMIGCGAGIGVVEDDKGCIAAKLQGQLFDLIGGGTNQLAADLGGAGEAKHGHIAVVAQDVTDGPGRAGYQIDLSGRQANPAIQQMEQCDHGQRRLGGRLDDARTVGRQRRREFLGNHANGEVPRRDQSHHSGRPIVDPPTMALGSFIELPRGQRIDMSGAELEEAGGVVDFTLGLLPGLAVLEGQYPADLPALLAKRGGDRLQPAAALVQGGRRRQSGPGRRDGPLGLRRAHGGDIGQMLTVGRIAYGKGPVVVRGAPGAVNVPVGGRQQGGFDHDPSPRSVAVMATSFMRTTHWPSPAWQGGGSSAARPAGRHGRPAARWRHHDACRRSAVRWAAPCG